MYRYQFLKAVLPNPGDLGENYYRRDFNWCRIRGVKDGKELTYYVLTIANTKDAYNETGAQGVSYTTEYRNDRGYAFYARYLEKEGVFNVEEFNPVRL